MTQAGQDFLPRVPKQTNGPCARPSRFRKRLFCAFGQSQARLKNPRTWKRRKEGKKEGRGRERSGMWRGGGGNKIRLCTKVEKKNLHFSPPPPKVIFGNILSVGHMLFFLAFLIPVMPRTREEVAS